MITAQGESFLLSRIIRKQNSPYEWETVEDISFFGRPADTNEKKLYRLQQGINASQESVYILTSNLPSKLNIGDKIRFNDSIYTVSSIGYYLKDSRVVNNHIMNSDYLIKRCPKGIVLS